MTDSPRASRADPGVQGVLVAVVRRDGRVLCGVRAVTRRARPRGAAMLTRSKNAIFTCLVPLRARAEVHPSLRHQELRIRNIAIVVLESNLIDACNNTRATQSVNTSTSTMRL